MLNLTAAQKQALVSGIPITVDLYNGTVLRDFKIKTLKSGRPRISYMVGTNKVTMYLNGPKCSKDKVKACIGSALHVFYEATGVLYGDAVRGVKQWKK